MFMDTASWKTLDIVPIIKDQKPHFGSKTDALAFAIHIILTKCANLTFVGCGDKNGQPSTFLKTIIEILYVVILASYDVYNILTISL
jgi:hypothetical protein